MLLFIFALDSICNVWKKNDDFWEFRKVENFEKTLQFVVVILPV